MTLLLTAEQLLEIAEDRATRGNPARIGGLDTNDLADFRHAVRNAAPGAVVHVPGCMAQTDHYPLAGELADGTRIYATDIHPGIDADDWARIAD